VKPANVFQLELAELLKSRRTLALKLGVTVLLGLPFVLFNMPLAAKTAGIIGLLIFTSFFGAAVALARRRADGRFRALLLLPVSRPALFLDMLLSATVLDMVQIGVVLALFAGLNGPKLSLPVLFNGLARLAQAVLLLNTLGLALGLSLRRNPEVHLAGALCTAVLLLLSGQIPVPERLERLVAPLVRVNPAARLAGVLAAVRADVMRIAPEVVVFLIVLAGALLWRSVDWLPSRGRR
jgi:ABC-type multidrug transport system permease subunit